MAYRPYGLYPDDLKVKVIMLEANNSVGGIAQPFGQHQD